MPAKDMREDVESWDVHVERRWPYYKLGGSPHTDYIPPIVVNISVNFLDETAALCFETAVRDLLQPEGC